jgi:hypothetical protein
MFAQRIQQRFLTSLSVALLSLSIAPLVSAQETFLLATQDQRMTSEATITRNELIVRDSQGNMTRYQRDKSHDSADGRWVGYFSADAKQAIRWPKSSKGNLEIGRFDGRNKYLFRPSQMSIQGIAPPRIKPNGTTPVLPPEGVFPNEPSLPGGVPIAGDRDRESNSANIGVGELSREVVPIRLVQQSGAQQQFLARSGASSFMLMPQVAGAVADWMLVPLANGMIRIQFRQGNDFFALGCNRQARIGWGPIGADPGQLWRVYPFNGGGGYLFESVMFPGQCLTWGNGGLFMQTISFAPTQIWSPFIPPFIPIEPVLKNVSTQVVPNPPLGPAKVELVNQHSETVWVLLADHRAGGAVKTIRIPAGSSETVELDRDAGSVVEETYEVLLSNGQWNRQVFRTNVPPAVLYDISIYEEFLQSIAIDRTGKSPNTIEDINYQPKSVGWFLIPPGDSIPEQYAMDVYDAAKSAGNPGAVRRIDPKLLDKPSKAVDPLKAILQEIQAQRGAF